MLKLGKAIGDFYGSYNTPVIVKSTTSNQAFITIKVAPAKGVRIPRIYNLNRELGLFLKRQVTLRPLLEEGVVAIDLPRVNNAIVYDKTLLTNFSEQKLPCLVGVNINGPYAFDLVEAPHVLIAGTTGSGKTNLIKCIIDSLTERADLYVVDPKQVDYYDVENINRVSTEQSRNLLQNVLNEMIPFHQKVMQYAKAHNWATVNERFNYKYTVVIIDECAELLLNYKEAEEYLCRVAQIGRAVGIHLVLATQRPTTDLISGRIKANFPLRIALKVASAVDARVIGSTGAENLRGKGDMLVNLERVQGYLSDI